MIIVSSGCKRIEPGGEHLSMQAEHGYVMDGMGCEWMRAQIRDIDVYHDMDEMSLNK